MKINKNAKYTTIAIYSCIVSLIIVIAVFAGIHFTTIISRLGKLLAIMSPLMYGFVIAYLANPFMKVCERYIFKFTERKKPHKKLKRILSLTLTYIVYSVIITMFVSMVIPQIVSSYNDLQSKMQMYVISAQRWVDELLSSAEFIDVEKAKEGIHSLISNSYKLVQNITPHVLNFVTMFVNQLKNGLLGIIFSIYFLLSKEKLGAQIKKFVYSIFAKERVEKAIEVMKFTDKTFGGFIIGKILDSFIIMVLTFVVLASFKMPYYQLVSVIIGVTNVIPFFGPFIGAIPSVFIIFIAEPEMAFWFLVIIFIIQQIDGNIIGPKILGNSTGLSAVWVVIAITMMGGLFGIVGMFFGVPAFAVIYYLIKSEVEKRIAAKGLKEEEKNEI